MWRGVFLIGVTVLQCHEGIGGAQLSPPKGFDLSQLSSIFYDPKTKMPIRISSIENNLVYFNDQDTSTIKAGVRPIPKIGYRSNGCTCQESACGCCLGLNIQQFNFNREGCMNFTYDPEDFSLTMDMFVNNDMIYTNTLSARNPPPLCIPMPYLPFVDFCAKLFDIYTPGQNLHMCFDLETRIQQTAILILHFDCMMMGNGGLMLVKPGTAEMMQGSSTESQVDSDVYDEVTEIKYRNATESPKKV